MGRRAASCLLATALAGACAPAGDPRPADNGSPNPRPEVVAALRADLAAPRHPADGGGRAWLAPGSTDPAAASGFGHWTVVYEAGPLGVAAGGGIYLQVSPFWGWSTPQAEHPGAPGFTRVHTTAAGVELAAQTLDQQLLGVFLRGRPLAPGERVWIDYGAGEPGALADRYAESDSRFWVAVDGDGDGVRGLLAASPGVDVAAGPAARLLVLGPGVARPGERVAIRVAAVDPVGNAGPALAGEVTLSCRSLAGPGPCGLGLPRAARLADGAGGRLSLEVQAIAEGIFEVRAEGPRGLAATSNPIRVSAVAPRVLWADLHGHSAFSDGTGTPEEYFRYARDVAALDVAALTDHDHWGMQPLARHPELWAEIRRQVQGFHAPGRFVTLLGYEWTSWLHGHRHVLYFTDAGEVHSSVDPATESPAQLWAALRGQAVLTFAHHSAGGPIATDWTVRPDPQLEPVTEVASVHGSSEAPDSPAPIYRPVAGNWVRDALGRGYRLGMIGSGDSHDGHPGLVHLAAASGGLAAILSEERTREGVHAALAARRVYATNGPRILLDATLDAHPMGTLLAAAALPARPSLRFEVAGTAPIERLDVIADGDVVASLRPPGGGGRAAAAPGERLFAGEARVSRPRRGGYLYVRAVQVDGGAAWGSPFFIE